MQIEYLEKKHAPDSARLHVKGISSGFISSLGQDFVTALYEAIAASPEGFGFAAVDEQGRVVGFVAFCTNIKGLYRSVIHRNVFVFGFLLGRKLFSLSRLKRIFQTLCYPDKTQKSDLPDAELLSIAVDESARGRGIAKKLIYAGLDECRNRGIEKIKVLVAAENQAANKLYLSCGFELKCDIQSHGVRSNIYTVDIQ